MSSGNAFYCINVRCDVLLDDILALAEPAALCLVCVALGTAAAFASYRSYADGSRPVQWAPSLATLMKHSAEKNGAET